MEKMIRNMAAWLLVLMAGIGSMSAQQMNVSGVVYSSEDDQPVIGATVLVKGTTVGTVTDFDGNFTLQAAEGDTLVVSYVGLEVQELPAAADMHIVLSPASLQIDEVMVVAYGTATKKSFTGSAANIKGESLSKKNPTELSKALAGEVAGVQVISSSGQPGSSATIRIRGLGSINSGKGPLYVVDGIPFSGDISGIDPSDIEAMTVLKDATATALYGSRGANGVVLVSTRQGKSGHSAIEAEVKYGVNMRLIPMYDVIDSPEQYLELSWEALRNRMVYEYGYNMAQAGKHASDYLISDNRQYGLINPLYNMWNAKPYELIDPTTGHFYPGITRKYTPERWEDHIFRNGQKMEASVKISGGSDKTTYFTSFSYLNDEGYYIESDFRRVNARMNLNHEVRPWLRGSMNMSYAYMKTNNPGQSADVANNGFQFVNNMPALYPVFQRDKDGNLIPDERVGGYRYDYGVDGQRAYALGLNPAGALQLDRSIATSHQVNGNAMLEATFLKDFKATVNVGVQMLTRNNDELTNPYYGDAEGLGRIYKENSNYLNLTSNQILSWRRGFGHHSVDAFIAHETTFYQNAFMYGIKSKIARPDNLEWDNAVVMDNMSSDTHRYTIESYFAQARYDYNNRYFFHGTIRRDGSSRFAEGHRWGTFGSVGAAWAVTNERFMRGAKWVDNLKLKVSYGVLGNQDFIASPLAAAYYPTEDLYLIENLNNEIAYTLAWKGNRDLTWEQSRSFNAGVEFDLWGGKLSGDVEYFHKLTDNLLFSKQLATSAGIASMTYNDGQMVNHGVELSLNSLLVNRKNVQFALRLNLTHYKNALTRMPLDKTTGREKPLEIQGQFGWSKGHSIYDYYVREYAGVDPQTGVSLWNRYYNELPNGQKEYFNDMELYKASNEIHRIGVETTSNYEQATKKYVDKSSIPAISGGFGFDLNVHGFDLSATFAYSLGGYGYDAVYADLMGNDVAGRMNWHKDMLNRWNGSGQHTDVPRLSSTYDKNVNAMSDRFITSSSYLNLANVRLAYNFPKKWLSPWKAGALSVYVTADNLFVLSARQGFVPMTSETGTSNSSLYVPMSSVMGGIKIQF